ncbi:hypothetical protein AVEN_26251-1 [Araneus ventricosus]|uniref:Uncharacterized protein n=1 Tax=Araneus ventricosus TaxID=182803 RepID=A0A4Y2ALP3_ARAVE|nr:hypothetical protein AVEN_26251-1 [Araneus ventricosus]
MLITVQSMMSLKTTIGPHPTTMLTSRLYDRDDVQFCGTKHGEWGKLFLHVDDLISRELGGRSLVDIPKRSFMELEE